MMRQETPVSRTAIRLIAVVFPACVEATDMIMTTQHNDDPLDPLGTVHCRDIQGIH